MPTRLWKADVGSTLTIYRDMNLIQVDTSVVNSTVYTFTEMEKRLYSQCNDFRE